MSPEDFSNDTSNSYSGLDNAILRQAVLLTEVAIDLRERHAAGEKYINYLKTMINGAERAMAALQLTSRSTLDLAQKFLQTNLSSKKLPENLKLEYDNLLLLINREANALADEQPKEFCEINLDQLAEKIRALEMKNRCYSDNNIQANPTSSRSSKIDINEKYPENLSMRESLIDLNNVVNLPPVPEDIFTSFSHNKPIRTSSLSSLKSMRKVKLFLQKAEISSDDDDSSDPDDHDYSRLVYGDGEEAKACHSPSSKKLHLGNIKEETQD